jgi:hypothetical protein
MGLSLSAGDGKLLATSQRVIATDGGSVRSGRQCLGNGRKDDMQAWTPASARPLAILCGKGERFRSGDPFLVQTNTSGCIGCRHAASEAGVGEVTKAVMAQ